MKTTLTFFIAGIFLCLTNVYSAEYNVGNGQTYPTLKSAFDAINTGAITGDIKLVITSNITETETAVLNSSGNAGSNYTAIKIYPNVAGLVISSNIAGATINLNGADNVTIDGAVNATGSLKNLVIENLSMATTATDYKNGTITFTNDATHNIIKNCILKGSYAATENRGIVSFTEITTSTGNSFNTITNNDFTASASGKADKAITSAGSTTVANTDNVISNNNFFDLINTSEGSTIVNIGNYNKNTIVSGNSFYETQILSTATDGKTITYIKAGGVGSSSIKITGNFIGGSISQCGGAALKKSATTSLGTAFIAINNDINPNGEISNNTIQNIDWANGADASMFMIYNLSVTAPLLIKDNIIGGSSDKKIKYVCKSTSDIVLRGIHIQSDSKIDTITVIGNTVSWLHSENTSGTKAASIDGIYNDKATNIKVINNKANNLFAEGDSETSGQSVRGIAVVNSAYAQISNNIVSDLTNFKYSGSVNSVLGIVIGGDITNNKYVYNNFIYNLAAETDQKLYGMKINSGIVNTFNNIISLTPAGGPVIYGIHERGDLGNDHNIYHNTIYIGGTTIIGESNALYVEKSTNSRDIRNNILINQRTGGPAKHFAINLNATGGVLTLDYNNYYVTATGYVGRYVSPGQTLDAFKTLTSKDANSKAIDPGITTFGAFANNYISTVADLTAPQIADVAIDFLGNTRTNPARLGAFDVTVAPSALGRIMNTDLHIYAQNNSIIADLSPLNGKSEVSVYNFNGQKIYFNVFENKLITIPVGNKGVYLVRIQNNSQKGSFKVLVF